MAVVKRVLASFIALAAVAALLLLGGILVNVWLPRTPSRLMRRRGHSALRSESGRRGVSLRIRLARSSGWPRVKRGAP
jgi:hypothetical protein